MQAAKGRNVYVRQFVFSNFLQLAKWQVKLHIFWNNVSSVFCSRSKACSIGYKVLQLLLRMYTLPKITLNATRAIPVRVSNSVTVSSWQRNINTDWSCSKSLNWRQGVGAILLGFSVVLKKYRNIHFNVRPTCLSNLLIFGQVLPAKFYDLAQRSLSCRPIAETSHVGYFMYQNSFRKYTSG